MIDDQSNSININDRANLLSSYISQNILAFQNLRNKNYKLARRAFKDCIKITKKLSDTDEIKHAESLTNYGIAQYFCGKFVEAFNTLESAFQISNRLLEHALNPDRSIKM